MTMRRPGHLVRVVGIVGMTLALVSSLVVVRADAALAGGSDPIVITGRGYGHGRGLGQYGALGYATGITGTPWTSAQILDHFYGGTRASTISADSEMTVRLVGRDGAPTVVTSPTADIETVLENGTRLRSSKPYVRLDVSGTDAFKLYEGTSCAGPWTTVGTFSGTEARLVAEASGEQVFSFGTSSDVGVVGDWNGDGTDTAGVFRSGRWYLRNSNSGGAAELGPSFGRAGDTPIVGDWNGDGRDTLGVRRGNRFYLRNSNTSGAADLDFSFGSSSDTPIVGDWNGDGRTTVGVRRGNAYYLRNANSSGSTQIAFSYGTASDRPVTGDWDGDGVETAGVSRGKTFYLRNSNSSGAADSTTTMTADGSPLAGDWIGSGRASIGNRSGQEFRLLVQGSPAGTASLIDLCTWSGVSRYRGEIRAANVSGTQRTVSALPMEDFLRGVVPAESPPSWGSANGGTGMAALEAQAVAARSFAASENRYSYAKSCDTTSCQVYRGESVEHALTDQAISNTRGVVRRFVSNNAVARTEFSSSTGGRTIGTPVSPFTGVVDEGDATPSNARHRWNVEVTYDAVGDAFCSGGSVSAVSVIARLPEDGYNRAKTVRVGCQTGARDVTGDQFRFGLGLYSTWFYLDGQDEAAATGPGIHRAGQFHLRETNDSGAAHATVTYGPADATPLAGDWNGDGVDTIGYRSGQRFHLRNSNSAGADAYDVSFGRTSDTPVVGDVDGDGDDDIGVRRGDDFFFETNLPSNGATTTFTVGALEAADQVIMGDWNNDGADEVGWLRGNTFHLGSLGAVTAPQAGTPVVVRLAAGSRDTVGVVVSGAWRILATPTNGSDVVAFQYGTSGDDPITGRWFR